MEPSVVSLVSDRADWIDQAIEVCRELDLAPEYFAWSQAVQVEKAGRALVADVGTAELEEITAIELWASRAWQPLSVLSVIPAPGTGSLYQRFQGLGYRRIVPVNRLPSYWRCIHGNLLAVLESPSSLIPVIARRYDCYDPEIISTLTVAADFADRLQTVEGLSRALGLPNPKRLRRKFAEHGCPNPKELLERLRLALAIDFAQRSNRPVHREEIAARFNYSSGDYLGKHAKRLTGLPFGRLLEMGPEAVL